MPMIEKITVYLLVFLQLKDVSCINFSSLGLGDDFRIPLDSYIYVYVTLLYNFRTLTLHHVK